MADITGTPRAVTIEGVSYRVFADANISVNLNQFEGEAIANSGKASHKFTRRIPTAESIPLRVNWAECKTLRDAVDSLETLKFSIEFRGGDIIKGEGLINLEAYESEEGRLPVSFQPDNGWSIFEA